MKSLKVTKKTVLSVDYLDLEKAIQEFYGVKSFSVVVDLKAGNDTVHEICVEKEPLDEYGAKKLKAFGAGGHPTFVLRTLLTDMCNQGAIESGTYLIGVCW